MNYVNIEPIRCPKCNAYLSSSIQYIAGTPAVIYKCIDCGYTPSTECTYANRTVISNEGCTTTNSTRLEDDHD